MGCEVRNDGSELTPQLSWVRSGRRECGVCRVVENQSGPNGVEFTPKDVPALLGHLPRPYVDLTDELAVDSDGQESDVTPQIIVVDELHPFDRMFQPEVGVAERDYAVASMPS
jgi:hypothetical protein